MQTCFSCTPAELNFMFLLLMNVKIPDVVPVFFCVALGRAVCHGPNRGVCNTLVLVEATYLRGPFPLA